MGRDKARLLLDGRRWAERVAEVLQSAAAPCLEVGTGASGLPAVADEQPGAGPLAAVATGWAALRRIGHHGPALVVATDLPLLTGAALRLLAGWPGEGSVVPVVGGRAQPVCARWSAGALARAAGLVAAGERAMGALLELPDVTRLGPEHWSAAVDARAWADFDSPDDLGPGPEPGQDLRASSSTADSSIRDAVPFRHT